MTADAKTTRPQMIPVTKAEKQGALIVLGAAAFQEIDNPVVKGAALVLVGLLSVAVYKSKDVAFALPADDAPNADEVAEAAVEQAAPPAAEAKTDETIQAATRSLPAPAVSAPEPAEVTSEGPPKMATRSLAAPAVAPPPAAEPTANEDDMDEL